MRKTVSQLKGASPRSVGSVWETQVRAMLHCFGARPAVCRHQQMRMHATMPSVADHSGSSNNNNALSTSTKEASEAATASAAAAPLATCTGPSPPRLHGAFSLFNLTDRISLADLDKALSMKQAERAWQLFRTLTTHPSLPVDGHLKGEQQERHLMPIPYQHCIDLYRLLAYARDLAQSPNVIAMRQQHLDKVAAYMEQQFGMDRCEFALHPPTPISPHKLLVQHLRAASSSSSSSKTNASDPAWHVYLQLLKEQGANGISRNHYLKLMAVTENDTQLPLDTRKQRIAYIANQHAGITCGHGRRLSAAGLEWLAHVHAAYMIPDKKRDRRRAARLVADVFYQGPGALLSARVATLRGPIALALDKDLIDELIWRLIPRDLSMAAHVFDKVHTWDWPQNDATYCNLIHAFAKRRNYGRALTVFERMLTVGAKPSTRTFNAVLHVFADQGWTDRASYMWETMHSLELVPDAATYSEMIRCYGNTGDLPSCLRFYQQMLQQQKQEQQNQQLDVIQPNVYTYSALIQAYGQHHDLRGVLQWFHTLLRQGLMPNEVIMANVLHALAKHHHSPTRKTQQNSHWQQHHLVDAIQRIAQQCIMAGVKTDVTLYTILLSVQAAASPRRADKDDLAFVLQVHRDMLQKCIDPNAYTYTTLIDLCGRHGYTATAQQIFDLMQASDRHQPTTATYCVMLDMWRRNKRKDKVHALLNQFLRECRSTGLTHRRLWIDDHILQQFQL
ncbi:hypothetical protein BC940DRAFT_294405 [Gongronella butleri]|nr:hypothetical protein BC940DRAFT_294405 [Gongronella butleri]